MSGNGKQIDPMQQIDPHLAGQQPSRQISQTLFSQIEEAANLVREIGRGLGEIGSGDNQHAMEFATFLEKEIEQYATTLLKRKRAELAKLERIVGKGADA
jgi:hypothetical protein